MLYLSSGITDVLVVVHEHTQHIEQSKLHQSVAMHFDIWPLWQWAIIPLR